MAASSRVRSGPSTPNSVTELLAARHRVAQRPVRGQPVGPQGQVYASQDLSGPGVVHDPPGGDCRRDVCHPVRDVVRATRAMLQDRRCLWDLLVPVEAAVFRLIDEDQIGEVAYLTRRSRLRSDEMLEGVHRDRRPESVVTQELQPGELLVRRHGPQVHVSGPQVGFRECLEPGSGCDAQFGLEGPGLVAEAADVEPGRSAGQDGQPGEIETETTVVDAD